MGNTLLGITVEKQTKQDILENIKKYLKSPSDFLHITSLNPENMVISHDGSEFKEIDTKSQIKIVDGVGVVIAARLLGVVIGPRITGVDLMKDLLSLANERRSRVMLIGGGPKVAEEVVNCQNRIFPHIDFSSLEGINDIQDPKKEEVEEIFSIVADRKPHFIFVAFGSPYQELWLYKNRHKLEGIVCMGVGGAFDFLSGKVARAPRFIQITGLEWLFRLVRQPWRLNRQIRLIRFVLLVLKEKFV